jgi:hypothetical protein
MVHTVKLGDRTVPLSLIEAYIRHLRKRRVGDVNAYEIERQRLHNAIFLAAGFQNYHPDLGNIPARKLAAMVVVGSIKDRKLERFNTALDNLVDKSLTCPACGSSMDRDMKCLGCGKFISVETNIQQLRKLAAKRA